MYEDSASFWLADKSAFTMQNKCKVVAQVQITNKVYTLNSLSVLTFCDTFLV